MCGNGGGAADCQHIPAKFTSVLSREFIRPGLAAIALTTDTSFITANANDFDFDGILSGRRRHSDAKATASSASAPAATRKMFSALCGMHAKTAIKTVALTGESGGKMASVADAIVKILSGSTQFIQESHISIGHILCALAELGLFISSTGLKQALIKVLQEFKIFTSLLHLTYLKSEITLNLIKR